ncbi:MAG: ATP-binding cassette domain-containing protein [Clostridia bacterium]|nr:ATP-binding cassette domain-containing protein [Clostridia bacterium]
MIRMENYSVELGNFKLKDVNLEIPRGEIFGIMGHTGAGKSVLLESLAGFYENHEGCVYYDDMPLDSIPLQKRRIGFVYQDYALFPHMKVRDNIEFGLKMNQVGKAERRERCEEIMEKLNISHLRDRMPATLSGGERQRTALARALVLRPEILFMDEPFSALDPWTRKKMRKLVRKIHDELGCTVVFVTHDHEDIEMLADRAAVVLDGRLRTITDNSGCFGTEDREDASPLMMGRTL